MKVISILFFLGFWSHLAVVILFNKYRVSRIREHIKNFRRGGRLSKQDFDFLDERYSNKLFGKFEFFPANADFPWLYDEEFIAFRRLVRRIFIYLLIAIPTFLIGTILTVVLGH